MRDARYYLACFGLGLIAGWAVGGPVAFLYAGLIAVGVRGVIDA